MEPLTDEEIEQISKGVVKLFDFDRRRIFRKLFCMKGLTEEQRKVLWPHLIL